MYMLRSKRIWILFSLVFILLAFGVAGQQAWAQANNSRYFPETGHWVTGEFLVMYESIPNPTLMYGAPITDAMVDSYGMKVQYFEKVRFELDPTLPKEIQVKLTPLGEYLYVKGRAINATMNTPACKYYAKTGYSICYAFLDFFNEHGGVQQFGYPISDFEDHDGRIVQYFQKARLEWHPENPRGQWVTVGNLGLPYFYARGEDPKGLNPKLNYENIPDVSPLELHTRAFVSTSVAESGGSQTIYIIVQDQNLKPVPNAAVEFKVTLPNGNVKEYRTGNTNEAGVSTLNFSVGQTFPGLVNISVSTHANALEGQTRTSFYIWW